MKSNYEPSQLAAHSASAAGNAAAAAEPSCGATPLIELGTYGQWQVGNLLSQMSRYSRYLVHVEAPGRRKNDLRP